MELKCDAIIKATKVDGVYDKDPMTNADAVMYKNVSFSEALQLKLGVMDYTAMTLAMENNVPIIVCSMFGGNIKRLAMGEDVGTTVTVK